MTQQEQVLFQHIQEYRKRFYLNRIIRGSLISALVVTSLLFVAILGEGVVGFPSGVRTGILLVLGITLASVAGFHVIWPATKYFDLGKSLSDTDIATLVRNHFPDQVDDKLFNLLQLRAAGDTENQLLMAAIRRKTEELSPIPFATAINLKVNYRYAKYLAVPLLLFLLVGFFQPDILFGGSNRLMNFSREFPKPPPYIIHVKNNPKDLIAGQNYELQSLVEGKESPAELFMYLKKSSETEFINYPMDKLQKDEFNFQFSDVREDFEYYIGNEEVKSETYKVDVFRRPSIRKFRVVVDYPTYTGLPNDTLSDNIGDFKALKGSQIYWLLEPLGDVSEAQFRGKTNAPLVKDAKDGIYKYSKMVIEAEQYYLFLNSARNISNSDTVRYQIDVLQDRYPSVFVNSPGKDFQADFNLVMPLDFEISDDYGFSKLALFYRFTDSEEQGKVSQEYKEIPLSIEKAKLIQQKGMDVDLMNLGMKEGDAVEYYLKVWDNDYITGPKASTSAIFNVNFPSLKEKFEQVKNDQENIDEKLDKLNKEVDEINKAIEKFQEKFLDIKKLNYDDKRELQKLLEKQKAVKNEMKEVQKQFQENKEFLKNNEMISQETLEKYEKLNELMKDMQNPELDKYLDKLQKEMDKMDPKEMSKLMEEAKFNEEDMKDAIERTMELMKQLQVQQKVEQLIQKLDNLKQRQDLLNEKLENAKNQEEQKALAEKQKELSKEMDDIKKDLKALEDLKKDTQTPDENEMKKLNDDANSSKENMDKAGEQMQSGQKKPGSESQKNASQKMQEMMDQLSSMSASSGSQQDQQNMEDLQDLLQNLLMLSFKQEDLRNETKKLPYNDPILKKKAVQQKQLLDDMAMVKDSLEELAKRVFQIEKFVTDESNKIVRAMENARSYMDDKNSPQANNDQHQAMTSINNLANMLTDVMQQMQQQMQSKSKSSSSCKKPGNGMPNMQQMMDSQKQLNGMMQQMLNMGKQGMDPKKLGEMAAMQEAIRKQMEDAHKQIREKGSSGLMGEMSDMMKNMEETKNELIKEKLTEETMIRQRQILEKMMSSFKAVREKDQLMEERESTTGKNLDKINPADLQIEEYKNRIRQELLKSNQLEYSSDFMILIEKYFKLLEKADER